MQSGFLKRGSLILVLACFVMGCSSVKELRSPIVFRSPVVLKSDEEKRPEASPSSTPSAGAVVAAGKTSQLPPAWEAKKQSEKEQAEIPAAASSSAAKTNKVEEEISMPADIPVFSSQELTNYRVSTLGKIQVSAPSAAGFSQREALKGLKVAAFKRYGSSAQGLTNIELKEAEGEAYQKVSGDVIMVSPKQVIAEENGAQPLTALAEPGFETGSQRKPSSEFPIDRVQVLISDQVYQRKFRILGKVNAVDKKVGFTKDEAIRELKIQAIKAYGNRAKGLLDVKLEKRARVFYYTKVRKPISTPEESENYERASAEVVVWE